MKSSPTGPQAPKKRPHNHGADGEGGIGPALEGQSITDIADKLIAYKNGETRGAQSALMWSQAKQLSDGDIDNIAAYVNTL